MAATKTCLKQNKTKKGKRTTRKKIYKWIQNKKSKQKSYGIFKYYKSSVDCRSRCWLCIILKNNRLLLIAENKLTRSNYNANEQMDLSWWFIFWDSSRKPEQKSTSAVINNQNLLTRFFFSWSFDMIQHQLEWQFQNHFGMFNALYVLLNFVCAGFTCLVYGFHLDLYRSFYWNNNNFIH